MLKLGNFLRTGASAHFERVSPLELAGGSLRGRRAGGRAASGR
jgi:hypothetical protein